MSVAEPDSPRWVPQTPNFERTDGGEAHMLAITVGADLDDPHRRHLQPIVSLIAGVLILIVP